MLDFTSEFPFTVAAAAMEVEADRGTAAERAQDPRRRRKPNRLAVSSQNRAISTAVRTVKRVTRAILCPLNEWGVRVSESLCRLSEDIYGLFRMELAMYYLVEITKQLLFILKCSDKKKDNLFQGTRAD